MQWLNHGLVSLCSTFSNSSFILSMLNCCLKESVVSSVHQPSLVFDITSRVPHQRLSPQNSTAVPLRSTRRPQRRGSSILACRHRGHFPPQQSTEILLLHSLWVCQRRRPILRSASQENDEKSQLHCLRHSKNKILEQRSSFSSRRAMNSLLRLPTADVNL